MFILRLYVDDMIILSRDLNSIERTVQSIRQLWDIKDMGEVSKIFGLSIKRDREHRVITISQTKYIEETLNYFNLKEAKPALLPLTDRNMLTTALPDEPQTDQSLYQQATGRRMWLTNSTRFDIAYAVEQLSPHCNMPTVRHWNGVL